MTVGHQDRPRRGQGRYPDDGTMIGGGRPFMGQTVDAGHSVLQTWRAG